MKTVFLKIKDFIGLPLRILLRNDQVITLGFTPLHEDRISVCMQYAQSPILDIGSGEANPFIKNNKIQGVGLDIHPFPGVNVCADAHYLPFLNNSFRTVSFITSFNLMKSPDLVLTEVKRVLCRDGVVLITVTNSFWLKLRLCSPLLGKERSVFTDKTRYGFSEERVERILVQNGFNIIKKIRFFFGVSQLIIATPENG
jgi:SAM-dependent methyltransferase